MIFNRISRRIVAQVLIDTCPYRGRECGSFFLRYDPR